MLTELLRSHVGRRSKHSAARHIDAVVQSFGNAEVEQLRRYASVRIAAQKDVRRFEVAVDDTRIMYASESVHYRQE
jgi:hypothetical protein